MDKNEIIVNNLREYAEVLDNQIDLLHKNLPNSKYTAMAYQKVLWTLERILRGKKYNEYI